MGPSTVSSSANSSIAITPAEIEAGACLTQEPERLQSSPFESEPEPSQPAVKHLVDGVPPSAPATPPPRKDWCGSQGTEWVPDGVLGVDWSNACKTHDECYGTPGANKFLCDFTLEEDISLACAVQDGGILCHIIAGIYFHGVRTPQGEEAFERAQTVAGAKAP